MNDPGLEDVISSADDAVQRDLRMQEAADRESERRKNEKDKKAKRREKPRGFSQTKEEMGLYQPTLWWFTSTAFPLIAGTFGPIANLFSVCALVQTWRVKLDDGSRIRDPAWLIAMNSCSLVLALCANVALLFNFARRIRYAVAQPITITLWYLSALLLAIPIGLVHNKHYDAHIDHNTMALSQSYYYGLISSVVYCTISSLLLISTLGSIVFHRYPPSFSTLTVPQRTLMLQTISFSLYLALGAGIFARIENWAFADGIYWALYTLLTIGLGSDFPLTTILGRMLLIPYAAFGITLIGLVVSSVRGLVLERAKAKVVRRHLGKERARWERNILRRHAYLEETRKDPSVRGKMQEKWLMKLPKKLEKHSLQVLTHGDQRGRWHRAEFELMRYIERSAESTERYTSLASSFIAILIVWGGGALVFWSCEHNGQGWTFPTSLYFTYTTLLTIGYGDFYPSSSSGKPFFVLWSLISIPAMTVLISNMGDTVVKLVQDATVWISKWTILPERDSEASQEDSHPEKKQARKTKSSSSSSSSNSPNSDDGEEEQAHDDLERDIEHVGGKIEKFEDDGGTPDSLSARLAREIAHLASDLSASPPKKYTWDEWTRWLEMLGERSDGSSSRPGSGPGDGHAPGSDATRTNREDETKTRGAVPVMHVGAAEPAPNTRTRTRTRSLSVSSRDARHDHESTSETVEDDHHPRSSSAARDGSRPRARTRRSKSDEGGTHGPGCLRRARPPVPDLESSKQRGDAAQDWEWTWLSDDGPLFSRKSETEWIMERLCFRLEEVLEDEIREARGRGGGGAGGRGGGGAARPSQHRSEKKRLSSSSR